MSDMASAPRGWIRIKLGDILTVVRGGSPRPIGDPKYFTGNIPFLKIADITKVPGKVVSEAETHVNEEGAKRSRLLQRGALILTNSGTVCIPKFLGKDACIHDGFVSFLDKPDGLSMEFLYYYFLHIRPAVIAKHRQGVTQVNLNTEIVRDFDLLIAPPREQHRIVEKIEELFSDLDAGVETLRLVQQQLKVYRQAVLKWAFDGRLTQQWRASIRVSGRIVTGSELLQDIKSRRIAHLQQELKGKRQPKELSPFTSAELHALPSIPPEWVWCKLIELADKITDGEHLTPKRVSDGIYLLSARNVQNGFLSTEHVDYIPLGEYERIIQRCNPEEGDVLISCSGTVGRVCIVPPKIKCAMVRSVALVKIQRNKYLSKFLQYQLLAPFLQQTMNMKKKATAQANLFLGPISELPIALPPLSEIAIIAQEIESRLSVCDQFEATIAEAFVRIESLRQSILKHAYEGKLVPQDPNDESAELLLKRTAELRAEDAKIKVAETKRKMKKNPPELVEV